MGFNMVFDLKGPFTTTESVHKLTENIKGQCSFKNQAVLTWTYTGYSMVKISSW